MKKIRAYFFTADSETYDNQKPYCYDADGNQLR